MLVRVFYRVPDGPRLRAVVFTADVPSVATLGDVLSLVQRPLGASRLSAVFEVQTDAGIWAHHDGSERPLLLPGATHRTWAELDHDDGGVVVDYDDP